MKGADVHSERSGYRRPRHGLLSAYAESMRFSVRVGGKDGEATREALNADGEEDVTNVGGQRWAVNVALLKRS